jgi:hypothetical protein
MGGGAGGWSKSYGETSARWEEGKQRRCTDAATASWPSLWVRSLSRSGWTLSYWVRLPKVLVVEGLRRHLPGLGFDFQWEQISVSRLKNPLTCLMSKHRSKSGLRSFSHRLRYHCVRVRQGFKGFLDL